MPVQHCLYLTKLHAKAADFDLIIQSPMIFVAPIPQLSCAVARSIEAIAGLGGKRVCDEPLGGKLLASQITACDAGTPYENLAYRTRRNGLQIFIEDMQLQIRNRTSDEAWAVEIVP
jgi:hypothetical protein